MALIDHLLSLAITIGADIRSLRIDKANLHHTHPGTDIVGGAEGGNIDGGVPSSIYGGITPVDGGKPDSTF